MASIRIDPLVDGDLVMHSHVAGDITGLDLSGYVEVAGDTMTGNLNVGTNKIELVQTDGDVHIKIRDPIGSGGVHYPYLIMDNSDQSKYWEVVLDEDNTWTYGANTVVFDTNCDKYVFTGSTVNSTLTIDTTNKRVGIGIVNPSYKLHIIGTEDATQLYVVANSTQTTPLIKFVDTAGKEVFRMDTKGYSAFYDTYLNTYIGSYAGISDAGSWLGFNTFIGALAGKSNTSGVQNTFIGSIAGRDNINGNNNTYIGQGASSLSTTGSGNIVIGRLAALGVRTGSSNTIIGHAAGYQMGTAGTGNVFIGNFAGRYETGDNRLYIANSNTSTPLIYGLFTGTGAGLTIHSQATDGVSLNVKGVASQASNLQEWKNSSNTVLAHITPSGGGYFLTNVGIDTTAPTNILSLGGNSARIFWLERHTTANTAGNILTITAGGATSGATDKAGGALILQGGLSTGSAESGVTIQGCVAGASGTTDRTQTTMIQVLGNKIGFFTATPVVQQTELTDELTTITFTAPSTPDYAIQDLVDSSAGATFGFATKDEGNSVLAVIANLQARVNELETKLTAYGLLIDAD